MESGNSPFASRKIGDAPTKVEHAASFIEYTGESCFRLIKYLQTLII